MDIKYLDNRDSAGNKNKTSDICSAIERGDEIGAIKLLSDDENPDEVIINNNLFSATKEPLLYKAVVNRMGKLTDLLLKHGADVNAVYEGEDQNGTFEKSTLFCAVLNEDEEIVDILLNNGANPDSLYIKNYQYEKKSTPALCQAMKMRNYNIVLSLIKHGADVNVNTIESREKEERITPAICEAVEWKNEKIINLLISKGANPNSERINNLACEKIKETPLYIAVKKGRFNIAKLLIDGGADINNNCKMINKHGEVSIPIIYETINKELNDLAKYMIERGVNVNSARKQTTDKLKRIEPIIYKAIIMHNTLIAGLLIENGCDVNAQFISVSENESIEVPAFHSAVVWGNEDIISAMLRRGADVNTILRKRGKSKIELDPVLYRAVDSCKMNIARQLIYHGANVNAVNFSIGSIPTLYKAIHWNDEELVELMIEKGVDVNAAKCSGGEKKTVLWEAIYYNKIPIAKMLKAHGADFSLISRAECESLFNEYKLSNNELIDGLGWTKKEIKGTNNLIKELMKANEGIIERLKNKSFEKGEELVLLKTKKQIAEELINIYEFANLFCGSGIHIEPITILDIQERNTESNSHEKRVNKANNKDEKEADIIQYSKDNTKNGEVKGKIHIWNPDNIQCREDRIEESKNTDFAVLLIVIVIIVTLICLIVGWWIVETNYREAIDCYNQGDYKQAIALLEDMDSYKDSKKLLLDSKYLLGIKIINEQRNQFHEDDKLAQKIIGTWYLPNSGSNMVTLKSNMTLYFTSLDGEHFYGGHWKIEEGKVVIAGELWDFDDTTETLTPAVDAAPAEYWVKLQ